MNKKYKFLQKHKNEFNNTYKDLIGNEWSLNFPVYLFDRDWFRLTKVSLYELAKELKKDNSAQLLPLFISDKQYFLYTKN